MTTQTKTTKRASQKRDKLAIYVEKWTPEAVPKEHHALAKKMTAHLEGLAHDISPQEMAIAAHLQGVRDTTEIFNGKGMVMS